MYKCLLLAFMAMALVSCKKDKDSPEGLKDQMIGRWNYVSLVGNEYQENGQVIPASNSIYTAKAGDYMEFRKDGTYIKSLGGNMSSGTYTTSASGRFNINAGLPNPCQVVAITDKTFSYVLEGPKRMGQTYIEYTHNFKK